MHNNEDEVRAEFTQDFIVDVLKSDPKYVNKACDVLLEWHDVNWLLSKDDYAVAKNPRSNPKRALEVCCFHWQVLQDEAVNEHENGDGGGWWL